jgi:hypothetical protein
LVEGAGDGVKDSCVSSRRSWRSEFAFWTALLAVSMLGLVACGGSDDPEASPTTRRPPSEATSSSSPGPTTVTADPNEDLDMTAADFANIQTMTPVKGYFIDNRLGHLDEAIAVANSDAGGVYPVGTIIQLVPQEAMVKRKRGWNPPTNDWEFFFLAVDAKGTTIETRGTEDTVNRFGGNCASCHAAADPKFDFVCEDTHGCEPLPIGDDVIESIQNADPRPR